MTEEQKRAARIIAKIMAYEKEKRLSVSLHLITNRYAPDGNQKRYFLVTTASGVNITPEVAKLTHLNLSTRKNMPACVIIGGTGMNMALALLRKVAYELENAGYKNVISCDGYI